MTRKRKTEARKKRKLKELDKQEQLHKAKLDKVTGGTKVSKPSTLYGNIGSVTN